MTIDVFVAGLKLIVLYNFSNSESITVTLTCLVSVAIALSEQPVINEATYNANAIILNFFFNHLFVMIPLLYYWQKVIKIIYSEMREMKIHTHTIKSSFIVVDELIIDI